MIKSIILTALFCNGLQIATWEGMVLYGFKNYLEAILPSWLFKPLIGCIYCMGSIWGAIIALSLNVPLLQIPIVMVCSVYVNGLVYLIHKHYDN